MTRGARLISKTCLALLLAAALLGAAALCASAQLLTTTHRRGAVLVLGGGPQGHLAPLARALSMAGYLVKTLAPGPGAQPLSELAARAGRQVAALASDRGVGRVCLVGVGAGGLAAVKLLQTPLAAKVDRVFFIALPSAGLSLPAGKGACISQWRKRLAAHYPARLLAEAAPGGALMREVRQKGLPVELLAGAVSARAGGKGACRAALARVGGDGLVAGSTPAELAGWDRGDRLYLVKGDHLAVAGQREVADLALRFLKLSKAGGPVACVLAIDGSGSVKSTDRHNLRVEAVRLMISRLAAGDQAAVVSFNTAAKVELPLVSLLAASQAKKVAESITRLPAGGDTDIGAGLLAAEKILAKAGPNKRKVVVLLTDGRNDPESANRPTLAVVRRLAASGVVVHAVGLTGRVDELFLSTLARAGHGLYLAAAGADQLTAVFDRLAAWVDRHGLILAASGKTPGEHAFPVDSSVSLLGVSLLSGGEGMKLSLLPPGGGQSQTRKARGKSYLFSSVPLPAQGAWRVRVEGPAGKPYRLRVVAAGNLKVAVKPPAEEPRVGRPWLLALSASQNDRPLAGVAASLLQIGPGKARRTLAMQPGSDTGFAGAGGGDMSALLPPFKNSGNARLLITVTGRNRQGEPFQRMGQATLHVSDRAQREALDRTLLGGGLLRGEGR